MINSEKFQHVVEEYKANFHKKTVERGNKSHWECEQYKWIAIKHFQEHWNVDADDFIAMFKEATSKCYNLLDSQNYFPRGMIIAFAEADVEAVRNMFKSLYNESVSVVDRVNNFITESERIRYTYGKDVWGSHYQNVNSISTYLWLRYPDKYYIYKYSECKQAAVVLESDFKVKKGAKADILINFIQFYNEIAEAASNNEELINLVNDALTSKCYPDLAHRTLAVDIGFFISRFYSPNGKKDPPIVDNKTSYWIYSPGDNACMWDEFYEAGIMAVGWSKLGDLSSYGNKDHMQEALISIYGGETSHKNDALAVWQFSKEMKPGDIVFVKKGMFKLVGRGVVTGDYEYQPTVENGEFCHIRNVQWTHNGEWEHSGQAVMKTLTDITQYSDYVERLNAIFEGEEEVKEELEPYTKENFLEDVYMTESDYDILKHLLENKQNIILQGAPGVGKTYAAKRLAYSILGVKDESKIEFVQFHQNYSYEDFVMGYKPKGETFELENGIFYRFCQKAASMPNEKFYFIIDEINRGNMSKIFGELMMLIEKGYRGTKATLAYSGIPFSVPRNLYIIGMMNTADRSLAMIDYALRRRFSFFDMQPGFNSDGFKKYQEKLNNDTFNKLIKVVCDLNTTITEDSSLGKGFQIGHSYFCEQEECTLEWMKEVVEYDIIPMLNEYWFDNKSAVDKWEDSFRGVFK